MTQAGYSELESELVAIGDSVGSGDVEEAAARMASYDAALRDYIETTAPHTPVEVLRELLRMQNAVLLQMRERQSAIGDALRRAHRQASVANAYTAAEGAL